MKKVILPVATLLLVVTACTALWQWVAHNLGGEVAYAAYTISNSARFNDDDSVNLSRDFGTATDSKIWTFSVWVKRANLGGSGMPLLCNQTNDWCILFDGSSWAGASDSLSIMDNDTVSNRVNTNALLRDPAAWVHVVVAVDTTQSTASQRVHMYINGVEGTYQTTTYPSQNSTPGINDASIHRLGSYGSGATYFYDGYLSDVYFVDGQQLTPTSFGEYDSNGYWRPKAYAGTYGTNGFHLDFANGADFGNDVSGNNNDFTANNLDASDQVIDTPTNSFATFNSLNNGGGTILNGNLGFNSGGSGTSYAVVQGTVVLQGKVYWEATVPTTKTYFNPGVMRVGQTPDTGPSYWLGGASGPSGAVGYRGDDGDVYIGGSAVVTDTTPSSGDTIMFAYDGSTGKLWIGRNGTWLNSGNPPTGTGEVATLSAAYDWAPALADATSQVVSVNFGQGGQSGLTYDGASGGYFAYTPPSGFKALSTNNLPTPAVTIPKNYFDVLIYNSPGLLVHADGADGSTTFTDSSASPKTITAVGNAQVDTAQSVFGGASLLLDGTNDSITIPSSTDFNFASSDFTIDLWLRFTTGATINNNAVLSYAKDCSGVGTFTGWRLEFSGGNLRFVDNNSNTVAVLITSSATWNTGTWYHVAVTRTGSTFTIFQNGMVIGTGTDADTLHQCSGEPLRIGEVGTGAASADFDGHIDEVRISKGIALWQSNFTPPSAAYNALQIYQTATTTDAMGFTPDIVWFKDRGTATSSLIFDTARASNVLAAAALKAWTIPPNWNSSNNSIEVIGGGAGGAAGATTRGGGGGGAGGYSKVTNVSLTGGDTIAYAIGSGGNAGVAGGDTYVCNSTSNCASVTGSAVIVGAKGGSQGSAATGGAGGDGGPVFVASTTYAGGSGGAGGTGAQNRGGGGGGGAGGPNAAGNDGGTFSGSGQGAPGGQGDGAFGGAGGASVGGGGGAAGNAGSPGTEWESTFGSGGGGGGGAGRSGSGAGGAGATGGLYGAGGGGGGGGTSGGAGGTGKQGVVRISYTPNSGAGYASFPYWSSNSATAEAYASDAFVQFLVNGFALGSASGINAPSNYYVSWMWKESPAAGVDIATYTGDNTSDRAISHSLGVAPDMVIVTRRDTGANTYVWHTSLSGATSYMILNSTAVQSTTNTPWGTGAFTSSSFMVTNNATNNLNALNGTYVAYLFASTTGFSTFGSYTGNGNASGPFVYTGFKPRYIMVKRNVSTTGSWYIWDTARDMYNPLSSELLADTTAAEGSTADLDVLVNGFKIRATTAGFNANGGVYSYAAFADMPLKYSAAPGGGQGAAVTPKNFLFGMDF